MTSTGSKGGGTPTTAKRALRAPKSIFSPCRERRSAEARNESSEGSVKSSEAGNRSSEARNRFRLKGQRILDGRSVFTIGWRIGRCRGVRPRTAPRFHRGASRFSTPGLFTPDSLRNCVRVTPIGGHPSRGGL